MARMFKVLPEIDTEFQRPFGYTMVIMLMQMLFSLFSYRSLLRTVIVLYVSYISILYKDEISKFIKKQIRSFKPVLAPYQSGTDDDSNDGYDEGDDKGDDSEHKHAE
tara:strand:+ start:142 stop:462 length:321 start_codon:yes stop_codon:yes gene_type:complete